MKKLLLTLILCIMPVLALGQEIKTQSEQFIGRDIAKIRMCDSKRNIAAYVILSAREGVSKQEFLRVHPIPSDFSDEFKKGIRDLIDKAYAWKDSQPKFADHIYNKCMASN